jgi:hypothetical protein
MLPRHPQLPAQHWPFTSLVKSNKKDSHKEQSTAGSDQSSPLFCSCVHTKKFGNCIIPQKISECRPYQDWNYKRDGTPVMDILIFEKDVRLTQRHNQGGKVIRKKEDPAPASFLNKQVEDDRNIKDRKKFYIIDPSFRI